MLYYDRIEASGSGRSPLSSANYAAPANSTQRWRQSSYRPALGDRGRSGLTMACVSSKCTSLYSVERVCLVANSSSNCRELFCRRSLDVQATSCETQKVEDLLSSIQDDCSPSRPRQHTCGHPVIHANFQMDRVVDRIVTTSKMSIQMGLMLTLSRLSYINMSILSSRSAVSSDLLNMSS